MHIYNICIIHAKGLAAAVNGCGLTIGPGLLQTGIYQQFRPPVLNNKKYICIMS